MLNAYVLGDFAKLRKVTIRFVMSGRPLELLGSHWLDFHEI